MAAGPDDANHDEGEVYATCPACGHDSYFHFIGAMGDATTGTVDLWNCEDGHTLAPGSIAAATVASLAE